MDWGKSVKLANPLLAGKVWEMGGVQEGNHSGDGKIEKRSEVVGVKDRREHPKN